MNAEVWVDKYGDILYAIAYRSTSDSELSKDLVQETYLSAVKSFSGFKGNSSEKTWLISILKNKIADHFRKKIKEENKIQDYLDTYFDKNGFWNADQMNFMVEEKELVKILNDCLSHLKDNLRIAIFAKYFLEKKGSEVSKEMNISETNYWIMVHRAKLQLKNCVDSKWDKNEL